MRIFLIIDETSFYHPNFISQFLVKTSDEVVGAAVVTKIPRENSIESYLIRKWYFLYFNELLKLAFKSFCSKILDLIKQPKINNFYSVRSVLKFYKIDYFEVENDINKKIYIEKIRKNKVDIIISSNSLIFSNKILDIPSICCLNRHSGLLPSYGGLWPVFQAYRAGESFVGVSIHLMEEGIDEGKVISNRKIAITHGCSVANLYEKCFAISADLLIESLDKIRMNDFSASDTSDFKKSYYSFPQKKHWIEFRERNGRFI